MDEGEEDENHIWNDWLPEPVALGIEAHEARRFRSLLTDAESAWAARKPRLLERPESVRDLSYRALIISTFVHARTRFPSDDLNRLVELALDIISETWFDVSLQRHWAKVLNNLLRKKKRGITLQIGWQQLYDIGVAVGGRNKHDFRLTGCSPLHPHIVQIMRRSRRFFPEGADVEIWAHFRSKIQYQLSQATHVNMAYLAHLMPTQRLATSTAPWNDWVDEWMNIWAALQHSAAWDCMWLHLLSFAAKHDTNGRIDWPKHAPRIWQTILQLMHLPLMGASSCPVEVSSTRIRSVYPISRFGSTVLGKSAARFIVYSLRSVGDAAALPVEWRLLQQLVGVLEQYYHPSNSMAGGYGLAAMLEQFLREACRHFMCRLRRQAAKPEACGAVLQRADRRRFAAALTQLASRAQFSKDPKLCSTACWALGRLAFVDADSVLPLVQTRFIQVLQSVGSSQQLRPAINSLACCIRPLLLCGLPQPLDEALDDQLSSHERGLQAVAGMMMETVPGVDINDPKKTAAVLGLYHAILCSLDSVWGLEHKDAAPPGTAILPLYLEEWVCGLLDRILAFLESAGTSQEYKMEGNSLGASDHDGPGGHLYELVSVLLMLMKKLPEELRHQTFSRLCSFLAGRILPGAAGFTSAVCEALVASDEAQGFRQLLQPLITALLPDIPSHASAVTDAKGGLSKGVEAAIVYRLTLLGSGVLVLNRHVVPHLQQLGDLAQRCLERGSRRIQAAAGRLLHSCIVNLTFYTILSPPKCPDDQREAHLTPQGVTPWVAPNGAGTLPPVWYIPGPAELAAANALLDRFVRSSAEQLKQMAAAGELANVGSPAVKQRLMGLLASLEPMGAVEHCLPDFPHSCPPTDTPFNIVGEQGPTVGTAELRLLVADSVVDALLAVHAAQQGAVPSATGMGSSSGEGSGPGSGETEVVASLMAAASMALTSAAGQEDEHRGVMLDSEPVVRRLSAQGIQPAAHSLLVPGSLAGSKKQYAPMDVLVRLQTLLKWRSSRAAFRALASPSSAAPELAQLHPTAVRLLAVVLQHSLHPYTRVRDISNNLLKTFTLRFPALVKCFLPLHLRGLSGLAKRMPERPPDLALQLEACTSGQLEQQLQAGVLQLCSEHTNGTGADGGAKGGAADGSSGPRGSSTMEPEAEAVVLGSTLWMMDHLSMLRLVLEDTTALSSVACAMILALRHPSVKAQLAVTGIAKELSGMLMPPPSLNTSYQSASRDTDSLQRLQRLLLTVTSQLASSQQGWRHACLAIGFLLLMLPGPASPMAPEVCRTMLETYIASSNPVMLLVSCQSLVSVLFPRCLYAPDSIHPDVAPQLQEVIQKPGFVDQLLAAFGSMHSHVDQEEQGRWAQTGGSWMVQALQGPSPHSMGMWLAIRVVRDFSCHLALSWNPLGPGPHALSREEFMPIVPLMATSLAVMAPTAFRTAIQPPLAACATKAEEECALVELLTGTLSHADNLQGSAWEELKGLLSRLWGRAPFESSSLWSVLSSMVTAHLLRYGPAAEQAGSGTGAPAGYADTMDVDGGARSTALENWLSWLGQGPAAGANSSTTSKWLSLNVQALMQLLCSLPPWHLPEFVETYLLGLVNELERLQRHDLQSVRLLVGRMAALTHTYPLLAPLQPPRQQPPPAAGATARSRLQAAAADAWECAQKRLRESADRVIAESAAPSGGGDGELEAPVGDAGDIAEVEAVLGTTLELVSRGCNGMLAATLANRLAGFMTSMLQVQVLRHPRLQQLSLACRTSLACIKYVCFNSSSLDGVLQQIVEVPTDEDHWHMRAAGLQALQRIWFQHFLLLTPEQMQLTRSFVLARLADSKQEVRDLASATLSGLMKGFSPDAAAELRSHLLQLAKTLFKPTPTAAAAAQTRGGDAAARAIRTRDQHACVLGLAAITASSPYDIPPWLPEVLLALVDAASHPPPIRPVVSKALGNFRRTHELEDAQGLASAFQPDQWDAIVGVTSHASYFT